MTIFTYITILFLTAWACILFVIKYKPIYFKNGYPVYGKIYNSFFYVLCGIMLFITAFRVKTFGGSDTINYVYYFQEIRNSFYYVLDPINDIGFIAVKYIISSISKESWFIIMIISLITLTPIMYGISKLSGDKIFSLILLIVSTTRIWIASMAIEKQFFSIVFIVLAIVVYYKGKKHRIPYSIALLIIACLFHKSNIALIPLIILFGYRQIPNKVIYICLFVCWLMIGFHSAYDNILNVFNAFFGGNDSELVRFTGYADDENFTNINLLNMLPLNLLPAIMLYFCDSKERNRQLLQVFAIGMCLYDLLGSHPIGIRISYVFMVIGCLAIPTIIGKRKKLFYLLMFVLMTYFGWRMIVSYEGVTSQMMVDEPYMRYSLSFFK